MPLDAVPHDDGEVLVAAEVRCVRGLQEFERRVPAALRPAVAIKVGEEAVVGAAVEMDSAGERRGRERRLRADALPVATPPLEPGELPGPEEFESRRVDARAVVVRVGDVVGPRAHLGDRPAGPRLEFPILEDRTVEAAHHEPREIDADAPGDRCGIERVGQVPGLLPLDHVHVVGGIEIAAVGAVLPLGLLPGGAPQIGLADVMVVGDRDGGPIAHHVAELQAELDPAGRVLRVAIGLIAGGEDQVGIGAPQALHELLAGSRRPRRVA